MLFKATRTIKASDIQQGDTVVVRQCRKEKLSTPYHPSLLTVTEKNHSMITAENATKKVTRNSSHFKKLFIDNSAAPPSFREEEITGEDSDHSPGNTEPPLEPDSGQTTTEFVPRRSTRVSRPPKRLIEEL